MTKAPSSRGLRIPVRYLGGHWEFKLGGKVPVDDSTTAELVVSRSSINDTAFLKLMEERGRHKVLEEKTCLLVGLSVKPERPPSAELQKILIAEKDAHIGAGTWNSWSSVPLSFVAVGIGKPNEQQSRLLRTERGRLWLLTHGIEAVGLGSTIIWLPEEVSHEPVVSLNHAYTKLSEVYETWRISHTGNIYKRIFYLESDSKWYSLELLRNREIIKKEHKIADSLWESFLKKVTSQNT
jgi:hypothetical protein